MKTVKTTAEYSIMQRGDKRYAVRGKDRKWINGDAKVEILAKEGLIEKPQAKAKPEPEAPADEAAEPATAEQSSGDEGS